METELESTIPQRHSLINHLTKLPPIYQGLLVFLACAVVIFTIKVTTYHLADDFWKGVIVEATGMLLDILVIGVLLLWLGDRYRQADERRKRIEEFNNDIDDYAQVGTSEARSVVERRINRLNCMGIAPESLKGAILEGADLRGANLSGTDLSFAQLKNVKLSKVILKNANLMAATIEDSNLRNADLTEANLRGATIRKVDLTGAIFKKTKLRDSKFDNVSLKANKSLSKDQLCQARSLREIDADEWVESIQQQCPDIVDSP